jgi:hypothetical protein
MEQLIALLKRWQEGLITKEEMYDQWFLIISEFFVREEE